MRSLPCFMVLSSLVGLPLTTQSALAQSFNSVRLQGTAPGQDLAVAGVVVFSGPAYSGSDERRDRALLLLDYQWANGWFAGVSNGVGIDLSSSPQLRYGVRVTADLGRKERRATALRGLGDVDAKAEGGAFFNVALADGWQVTTALRYGSGTGGSGLVADAGLLYGAALAPQWRVGCTTFARLHSTTTLAQGQAAAHTLAAYEADFRPLVVAVRPGG